MKGIFLAILLLPLAAFANRKPALAPFIPPGEDPFPTFCASLEGMWLASDKSEILAIHQTGCTHLSIQRSWNGMQYRIDVVLNGKPAMVRGSELMKGAESYSWIPQQVATSLAVYRILRLSDRTVEEKTLLGSVSGAMIQEESQFTTTWSDGHVTRRLETHTLKRIR